MRVLLLDNYDSFTYNLAHELLGSGADVVVLRHDAPAEQLFDLSFEAVLLSPGPETPDKAGQLLQAVDFYAGRRPMLGICLGHQAIGMHFGSRLVRAYPMHGRVSTVAHTGNPLFAGMPPTFEVVRYHSLMLDKLGDGLEAIARTDGHSPGLMAVAHQHWPIWGVQWHPEAYLSQHGGLLLNNWLGLARQFMAQSAPHRG